MNKSNIKHQLLKNLWMSLTTCTELLVVRASGLASPSPSSARLFRLHIELLRCRLSDL